MAMRNILIVASALALAGCGAGETGNEAAANEAGEAAAPAAAKTETAELRPGMWEIRMELPTVPDMPKEMADMVPREMTAQQCITPEEARASSAEIFGGEQAEGCTTSGVSMADGKMRGTLTCPGEAGQGPTRMVIEGSYSPESYDIRQRITAGGGDVTEMRVVGRRVGDCPAEEAGAEAGNVQ